MCAIIKIGLILCVAVAAHGFSLGPTEIVFHLFTRNNPTQSQPLLPSLASILASAFQSTRRTVFTVHSYGETVVGNFNAHVVSAHLATEDVNVIAIDWSPGASVYTHGLSNVRQVGDVIAQFVNLLNNEFGYGPANVRIVGVGLGAHIAGIAARRITGTVPHIVALDPSLHGWTHHPEKLSENDAGVVEVLYTTAGEYGYDEPLGSLNFYSNGGSMQTGCGFDISCSHMYSYIFYAESIRADINNAPRFVGTACDSYEQARSLRCTGARDVNFGGIAVKSAESGIYTFLTNITPPFARG